MSGETFTHIGVHVAEDSYVRCAAYPQRLPILTIRAASATVDVSIRDEQADENAVRFARGLAKQAALFASEVERLHAQRLAATA